MLFGTLGASLLGNLLTGKGKIRPGEGTFKKIIGNKKIITSTYRIQAYDSIKCGYFCIGFIDFMLKDQILLDYTNLFSPNDYENMVK